MKHYNSNNREQYIQEVLIPRHLQLMKSEVSFAIKDCNSNYVICSDKLARWLELYDGMAIKNKKITDFSQFNQHVIEETRNSDNLVKLYLRPIEEILVVDENHTVIVNKMPLFYPDGSFFGIRETIRQFELIYPFQFMHQTISGLNNARDLTNLPRPNTITEDEKSVIFLLLSGHGRSYIAEIMKVNISKVSRIIAELCNKFGVISHHQERLISCAINRGIYRFIPKFLMKRISGSLQSLS